MPKTSLIRTFITLIIITSILNMKNSIGYGAEQGKNNKTKVTSNAKPLFPSTTATRHQLKNGMNVILDHDPTLPIASVQVWCKTGSIFEDELLGSGVSHFVEHLVFKGSSKRKVGKIASDIQEIGGYLNAYTSYERTVYYVDCPREGVPVAIDVLGDLVSDATFPKDEFERERDVVRREIDMGKDSPSSEAFKLGMEVVFEKTPYRYPVIGYRDVFDSLTYEQVVGYYKKKYVPRNLFFVIVGDIDKKAVLKQIKEKFDKIPFATPNVSYIPDEPRQLGKRERILAYKTNLSYLNINWLVPGLTHPDSPALDVLATVIGDGYSSRLYTKIRDEKNLVNSISAYAYTPQYNGIFSINSTLPPENKQACIDEIMALLEDIKQNGITETELNKARKTSLSSQFDSLKTVSERAESLGTNWIYAHNLDFTQNYIEAINNVTIEDIKRVTQKYLRQNGSNIAYVYPKKNDEKKSPQNKTAVNSKPETKKFKLDNGITIIYKEDKRLPVVNIYVNYVGSILLENDKNNGISQLMSKTILKGTKTRSAKEIVGAIENNGGEISAFAGNNSMGIAAECMTSDLNETLEIITDVIQNPTFPENYVANEKKIQLRALQESENNHQYLASRAVRQKLFPGQKYARLSSGTTESVTSLNSQKLKEFHSEVFTADNMVVAMMGDVDSDEVRKLAEKYFGNIETNSDTKNFESKISQIRKSGKQAEIQSSSEQINLNKRQAVIFVGYQSATMFDEDALALTLIDEACSDMASRLFTRIREEQGLAYYVGSAQLVGPQPGGFFFYLGTSPEKAEHAKSELLDEIAKMAKNGLSQAELDKAKKTYLSKLLIKNQSNESQASTSATNELLGLGYDYNLKLPEKIQKVSLQDVKKVCQKYFLQSPQVVVVVQPKSE